MAVHQSRKSSAATTAAAALLAALLRLEASACTPAADGRGDSGLGDGGSICSTSACESGSACPTLTCTCPTEGNYDSGQPAGSQVREVLGDCSDGCCVPCPSGCS